MATAVEQQPFSWRRWPGAESFVAHATLQALDGNAFAADLAARMTRETGTRFVDWIDHLTLTDRPGLTEELGALGFIVEQGVANPAEVVYEHPGGLFPRFRVRSGGPQVIEVAIKVESVADFSRAHDLGLDIEGSPGGPLRVGRVPGSPTALAVYERRAYRGFDTSPEEASRLGRTNVAAALSAREIWHGRKRHFVNDEQGMSPTENTLEHVIDCCEGDTDLACHLVFEVERAYWESRNRAARVQKARQDRLGLGWANHDHHTFRCSRRLFPRIMGMFRRLGFQMRERFHAGQHAGWGAQVLEHRTTGIVIFADLDLAPGEIEQDFTQEALPDLPRPNTVGLWVALHGESILGAGMHHLEAQFDFDALRKGLLDEAGIETMKPFSDFPFLRQAFTAGERWQVAKARADRLLQAGWIDADQHAVFLKEGAIGSHLENLERREGYKGFNQQAVSSIIAETDPRRQPLAR